jgi:hypothetical protein
VLVGPAISTNQQQFRQPHNRQPHTGSSPHLRRRRWYQLWHHHKCKHDSLVSLVGSVLSSIKWPWACGLLLYQSGVQTSSRFLTTVRYTMLQVHARKCTC